MATVKKRAVKRQMRKVAAARLFVCGLDIRWCQIREAFTAPKVHTTTTKIKGKVSELVTHGDQLRRRQVLREGNITVHVFTGGKVLATVQRHRLVGLGLYSAPGTTTEVPETLVARIRKGCKIEQALLEGE